MKTQRLKPVVFNDGNNMVHVSIIPEGVTDYFTVDSPITLEDYSVRHVAITDMNIIYPDNTSEVVSIGGVWPGDSAVGKSGWGMSSVSGDGYYCCIVPRRNYDLRYDERLHIESGQTYVANKGSLLFAFGSDYTVNGVQYTQDKVFAAESGDLTLVASVPTMVTVVETVAFQYQPS